MFYFMDSFCLSEIVMHDGGRVSETHGEGRGCHCRQAGEAAGRGRNKC